MTEDMFEDLLASIQRTHSAGQTLELKAAEKNCPKYLFDTLSSFSNQDEGGTIVFGISEERGYEECGVYDAEDLMERVMEQGEQMEPPVRPVFTILERNGKTLVAAEVKALEPSRRPCHYRAKGLIGSYERVGEGDKPMSEYAVFDYGVARRRINEETRLLDNVFEALIDTKKEDEYIASFAKETNLTEEDKNAYKETCGLRKDGKPTLLSLLMFGKHPQFSVPALRITAVRVQGREYVSDTSGQARFIANANINGTIPEMIEEAVAFVSRNTDMQLYVDKEGFRKDRPEYPGEAVREAIVNALVHRDYSEMTEGRYIMIRIFYDRMEIISPGRLWGKAKLDNLGTGMADPRNRFLMSMLENMGIVENRHQGIRIMKRALKENGMPEPEFRQEDDTFIVTMRKDPLYEEPHEEYVTDSIIRRDSIREYLRTPRTRREIADFLHLDSQTYAIRTYITPLVEEGCIELSVPDHPRSSRQTYRYKF